MAYSKRTSNELTFDLGPPARGRDRRFRETETPPSAHRAGQAAPIGEAGCSGSARCSCSPRRSLSAHRATIRSIARSMATAEQRRDFVPSVRAASGAGERQHDVVTLAGHDLGIRGGEHLCARQRLYRQAQCRHRRSREGRGSCWRRSPHRSSITRSRRPRPRSAQLQATLQQAQANKELAQVTWDRDSPLVEQGLGDRRSRATSTSRRSRRKRRRSASRKPISRRSRR